MFNTAQNHSNTHGSIETNEVVEERTSHQGYRNNREIIREETDLSIMEDRYKLGDLHVSKFPNGQQEK